MLAFFPTNRNTLLKIYESENITNSTISFKLSSNKTANISSIDLKESIVKNKVWLFILGIIFGICALKSIGQIINNPMSGIGSLVISSGLSDCVLVQR